MKRIALRITALLAGTVVAVAAWILAAWVRPGFIVLALVALVAFLLSASLLLRLIDRGSGAEARLRRRAWLVGGSVVYMSVAHLTVGRVPARTMEPLTVPPTIQFWTLPDGARLAYRHVAATVDRQNTPVIVLHGGPGIPLLSVMAGGDPGPLDFVADAGYDVYYYDQRGAGYSSRLDLRRDTPYSVAGHVTDLESVRVQLNAERMILAGHGWGATLAAHYLLAHPERVERLVVMSPAPLWYPAFEDLVNPTARVRLNELQASALAVLERPPFRLVIGRLTAATSRAAAHTLVADWEADQWWTRRTEEAMWLGQPMMTCWTERDDILPPVLGLGYFAHSYTIADALRQPDPRPALSSVHTPTLILRGLCDYIRPDVAYDYLRVLPNALYVALVSAGHLSWLEQPEGIEMAMLPFLADEPVPLTFYHPGRAEN